MSNKLTTIEQIQRTAKNAAMSTTATKFVDGSWIIYISPTEPTPSKSLMEVALFIEKERNREKINMQNANSISQNVSNLPTQNPA